MTEHQERRHDDTEYKELVQLIANFITNFDARISMHIEPIRAMIDKHEKDMEGNGKQGLKQDTIDLKIIVAKIDQEVTAYRWVIGVIFVAVVGVLFGTYQK